MLCLAGAAGLEPAQLPGFHFAVASTFLEAAIHSGVNSFMIKVIRVFAGRFF